MAGRIQIWIYVCVVMALLMGNSVVAENRIASLKKQSGEAKKNAGPTVKSNVAMYVFEEKLKTVISEIVRRDKISLKMENNVAGMVRRRKLTGTRHEVLQQLSGEFDFDWFEYNQTLYISSRYERSTKFFTLNAASLRQVLKKLDEAGKNMEGFQVQYLDKKTASVSGPPSYIAIVATFIDTHKSRNSKVTRTDYNVKLYKGVKLHKIELEHGETN